jgi:hypothetical protein
MTIRHFFFGSGFSVEESAANWHEIEADLPPPQGPGCPLTADLLELVLGLTDEPAEAQRLQAHLAVCLACQARFKAQQRAVERHAEFTAVNAGPTLQDQVAARFGRRRTGKIRPAPALCGAIPDGPRIDQEVILESSAPGRAPLHGFLHWTQKDDTDAGPWYLTLSFSSHDGLNPLDELDALRDRLARLTVSQAETDVRLIIDTRLGWDHESSELVSDPPQPVPQADPHTLEGQMIEFLD